MIDLTTDFESDRKTFFDSFPGVKTFQLMDDREPKDPKKARIFHCTELPVKWALKLERLNELEHTHVGMTINETDGKGRRIENIVRVRAVFADFDGVDITQAWKDEPSLVVESSPGKYHAYWLTRDDIHHVPLEAFRSLQEGIIEKYGTDPVVKDLPRAMRVPGFLHMKGEPFLSRVIHHTGARFKFGELVELFPPIRREQWSAPQWRKNALVYTGEFKGGYGTTSPGRNCHVAARIGGMIKRGLSWDEIEIEAFKEAQACVPPLSEYETMNILKSCRRYAA
ncbi:DNA-primase RepB domain-containing protein [Desulfobacter postgatei]|uniref:DNA-primase RepB domain-containing protein n=1 Tax=Desulfobacter postgatei TaxID=2293 RepID=UPI002FD8D9EA